jgi:hypothetical protein
MKTLFIFIKHIFPFIDKIILELIVKLTPPVLINACTLGFSSHISTIANTSNNYNEISDLAFKQ